MSPEKKELNPSPNKGVDRSSSIVGANAEDASSRLYSDTLPTSVRIQTDKQRGSGFFVDGDGRVATASHVVINAKELFAYTADGKKYRAVLEKLGDTDDVAILKLRTLKDCIQSSFREETFRLSYRENLCMSWVILTEYQTRRCSQSQLRRL